MTQNVSPPRPPQVPYDQRDTRPIRPGSSFESYLFGTGYALENVDPDALPGPADMTPSFRGPLAIVRHFGDISDSWQGLARGGLDPVVHARQLTLTNLTRQALDCGLLYRNQLLEAVADALELLPDDPLREMAGEYSLSTELFFARTYLISVQQMADEAQNWLALQPHEGQVLAPMRVNFKQINAVRVVNAEPPNLSRRDETVLAMTDSKITVTGKRGRWEVNLINSATELKSALDRHQQCRAEQKARAESQKNRMTARPRLS